MPDTKYRIMYPGSIHLPLGYVVHEFRNWHEAAKFAITLDETQAEYEVDELRSDGDWYNVYMHDIMEYLDEEE